MERAVSKLDWNEIDLVVFDMDGTLYDQRSLRAKMLLQIMWHAFRSRSLHVARIILTFRKCREELADNNVHDFGNQQYAVTAARHGCSITEVKEIVSEWIELRPLSAILACRYTGIELVFNALNSSGKTIAVLSDYPAEAKLDALGLKAHFVVSALDEDVGRLKPDPTGLYKILKLVGTDVQRSVMIGDRFDRDGEVARRVGMRAVIKSHRSDDINYTFQSYADDIFSPLLKATSVGDRASSAGPVKSAIAALQNLKGIAFGYTLVGALAAAVDILAFRALIPYLQSIFIASACSFLISSAFQYWVFSVAVYRKTWRSPQRAGMFTIATGIGLLANASATTMLAAYLPITPTLAKIGGIGLAFGLNFLLNTYIVFRK
jgi:HAD superfamily hydrolase (TIGR01549 family)